jgi:hypothetical protein
MTRLSPIAVVCAVALSLSGCSDGGGSTSPQTVPEPAASPQPGTPAATPPATQAAPNMPATTTPVDQGQGPMMQPAAPSGGAAGSAAMQPSAASPTLEAPAPGDSCSERRVSYTKPCSSEPDPCNLKSGFPGDEYCLKPPAEGEGIQIHIGPKDYKSMAEVMKYVLAPGEEFNNSVIGNIPLTEDKWFSRITVHMRPGSHHWISTVVDGKPAEQFYDDTGCGAATSVGSVGGGQNLIYDNPPMGKPAPENEGLGRPIPGNSSLCMNLHAYNFSDKPQVRELWINVYFVDEAKVTQRAKGIGIVGGLGLSLAPGQNKEETYEEMFTAPGRIIQLFGHRHVWTPRFAVWLNEKLIYDSWSWQESVTFNYDSLTMNPPIDTAMKIDGAVSGSIDVKAGDKLKFTCFIENKSDTTLRFSNELRGGEMCNLWGSAVGTGLSASRL